MPCCTIWIIAAFVNSLQGNHIDTLPGTACTHNVIAT